MSTDGRFRAFFQALSRPPQRAWPDGVQHHGARFAIVFALASVTALAFPVAPVPDFPEVERGMVLSRDIIAEVEFQVAKPEPLLRREREAAAAAVAPVLRYDPTAADSMQARIAALLDRLDSAFTAGGAETDERLRATLQAYSLAVRPEVQTLLRSRANREALRQALRTTIDMEMRAGVARTADVQSSTAPQVLIIREGVESAVPRGQVRTAEQLWQTAARSLPGPPGLAEFQHLVLVGLFVPSLRHDRAATEAGRQAARNAVPTIESEILAGERVIAAHERIGDEDIARLDAYASELARLGRLQSGSTLYLRTAGSVLLNALLLGVFGVLLLLYRPQIYGSFRAILVLAFLYLAVTLPAAAIAGRAAAVLIPIAFPALVVAVLWDGRVALTFALVVAVLLSTQGPLGELSTRIFLATGGAAAALSVRAVHRRAHGLILGAVIALAYIASTLAVGLLLSWTLPGFATTAALGSLNGVGSALIAVGLMPVFEACTGITTDQTLLELGDLNGPLLKRMSLEASGTYAHSIHVAHLSEAAARAIGANPLLARVGAYYHDIGKMAAPQYFVENQSGGRNPHDRLPPEDSVAIVRGHVLEGLRMADQAKLPLCIKELIPQHHGTQLIGFFFERAKERDGRDPDRRAFSYPGPRPRTAEAAILMLADSVESAVKALDDPTPERLRDLVDKIVQGKVNRRQLDESPLTFRDVAHVKRAFMTVLRGMYHGRIDYPASAIGLTSSGPAEPVEPAGPRP